MLSQIQEPTKLASLEFNKKLYQLFAGEHDYVIGVQQGISDYQDDGNVALLVDRLCRFIQRPECLVLLESVKPLLSPSHQILFEELRPFSSNCRTVILKRTTTSESFGFHVRGGTEYGCHFYVSHVSSQSPAQKAKLYPGDVILSVNNFDVQSSRLVDFKHYVKNHKVLFLIVCNLSLLPLDTRFGPDLENLTPKNWVFTESNNSCRSLPVYKVAVFLKDGFGCSLRKEPGKSGIYAANIVPFSVAHELGIRDGDQILFVNDIKFFGISKTEAIMAFRRKSPASITFCKSSDVPQVSVAPKSPTDILRQIEDISNAFDSANNFNDHGETLEDSWNDGTAFSNTLKQLSFSPEMERKRSEEVSNAFEDSFKIFVYNQPESENDDILHNTSPEPESLRNKPTKSEIIRGPSTNFETLPVNSSESEAVHNNFPKSKAPPFDSHKTDTLTDNSTKTGILRKNFEKQDHLPESSKNFGKSQLSSKAFRLNSEAKRTAIENVETFPNDATEFPTFHNGFHFNTNKEVIIQPSNVKTSYEESKSIISKHYKSNNIKQHSKTSTFTSPFVPNSVVSDGAGNNSVRSVASDTKKKKKAPLPPNRSHSFQMPSQVAIRSRETNGLRKATILFQGFFGIKLEGGKLVESGLQQLAPLVIKEIYEESPLRSCLSEGDKLVAIDGIQLGDKSVSEINTLLGRMERNKEPGCSIEILFEPICHPNPKFSYAGVRISEEVTTF